MKRISVLAGLWCSLLLPLAVSADQVFEAVEHVCNTKDKRLQILYHEFWNSSPPGDFISGSGEHQRTCKIDNISFETDVTLFNQGGGTCGATPGSAVVLRYNNTQIYGGHLHHCTSNWIDRLQVVVLDDAIEMTICGSVYSGESKEPQEGCYTARQNKAKMPVPLISEGWPPPKLEVFPSDLCSSQEEVVFSCRITEEKFKANKERFVSLCASPFVTPTSGYLQYRFGRVREKPELTYPSTLEHPKNHFQFGALELRGEGRYLAFNNEGYRYHVVFTDDKKGVLVEKSGTTVAYFPCQGDWWHLRIDLIENAGIPKR